MRRIIIASHGEFAKGLKNSVELIVGELASKLEIFCLYPSQSPMDFKERTEKDIQKYQNTEFIFLCDLKGGSVHTACSQLCIYKNVKVFSGTNMNLILDLLLSHHDEILEKEKKALLKNAKDGITLMTSHDLISSNDEEF